MLELRVLFATALLLCGVSPNVAKAATFNVVGALNVDGQTLSLGPAATLNLEIVGPISSPFNQGYELSVGLLGAPSTTSSTANIVPVVQGGAFASINGTATTNVNTTNCLVGCGLTNPISGNTFVISDVQRAFSISLAGSFLIFGAADQLPANDVITIDYNMFLNLPPGLSAEVTPLPDSIWLLATGFSLFACGVSLQRRKQRVGALAA
jgi:hypothetical protein